MDKKFLLIGFLLGVILTLIFCLAVINQKSTVSNNTFPKNSNRETSMKIKLTSVFVDDQEKALKFYTEVLGFVKKTDLPAGKFRWLTVVSPDGPGEIELLLEPNETAAARTYQQAIYDQGIPATAFFVDDIQKEFERMKKLGVKFIKEPMKTGTVTMAIFDDTCGNLIQLVEE
jgi:catechol 2,3-dioxygenase-like lactoylglutathione lyase family enzyme